MNTGLRFLMAAKRCEMAELAQLARTCELVTVTAQLIHGLQRERGLCNVYLSGPPAPQSLAELSAQTGQCDELAHLLRQQFDELDTVTTTQPGHGARLFSRIAYVLHGLDELPLLRAQVASRRWSALQATTAYIKLVAGLLAVVFEAADGASDPEVSRLLVALFNFMQGKELAGQERATGARMLTSGLAEPADQQHLLHLIESQERCFQVFADFASTAVQQLAQHTQAAHTLAELERMRRILCTQQPAATALPSTLGPAWFACCTQRMNDMVAVETRLTQDLQALCQQRIEAAQHELQAWERLRSGSRSDAGSTPSTLDFFSDQGAAPAQTGLHGLAHPHTSLASLQGSRIDRSILELVHEQSLRLQAMSAELDTVRASLNERKLIERAKGILMAHRQLSEADAHKLLRQTAMNQNRRLGDVAEAVLAMADILPPLR